MLLIKFNFHLNHTPATHWSLHMYSTDQWAKIHSPCSSETAGVSQEDVPLVKSWPLESFEDSSVSVKLPDPFWQDDSFSCSVSSSSFSLNLSLLTSCLSASESPSSSSSSSGCLFFMPLFGVMSPSDSEESLQQRSTKKIREHLNHC